MDNEALLHNTTSANATSSEMIVYRNVDIFLACSCLVVFVVGVSGNMSALFYFMSRGRDLPTRLYTLLAFIDSTLCIFILPVGLSFAYERAPVLFAWPVLCTLWGAIWTWAPYMSVFVIAILSITRTLVLINPLRIISKNKVIVVVALYGIWIAVRMVAPMVVEGPKYHYLNKSVECMWTSENSLFNNISLITIVIFLALPVFPILLSCIISSYVIMSSIKRSSSACLSAKTRKRSATITILILTGTYLIFNFPLFVYLVLFSVYYITGRMDTWLNGSVTLDNYLWNLAYIILIGVNSLANFVIYTARIRQFRSFLYRSVNWWKRNRYNHTALQNKLSPVQSTLHDIRSPRPSTVHSAMHNNRSPRSPRSSAISFTSMSDIRQPSGRSPRPMRNHGQQRNVRRHNTETSVRSANLQVNFHVPNPSSRDTRESSF